VFWLGLVVPDPTCMGSPQNLYLLNRCPPNNTEVNTTRHEEVADAVVVVQICQTLGKYTGEFMTT